MKKLISMVVIFVCCITLLTACAERTEENMDITSTENTLENSEIENAEPSEAGGLEQENESAMLVRMTFDEGEAILRLEDNAAARDFASRLPMTQTFEDFNSIEKICRLSDRIATDGVETGVDPDVADVTLYAPWNTLVFYYEDYGYNDDLISIGHVDSGMELLSEMGDEFTVTMELIESDGQVVGHPSSEVTEITMTVDDTVITAELTDSETTRSFLETLPRTLTMNRYGDREYYGRMEEISENGEVIPDFSNGDVTYYPAGPSFAVFFFGEEDSNQVGLIRMGKITSDLSVFDTFDESIEVYIEVQNRY